MSEFKASALAPSNIAFTKYWGRSNAALTLPLNDSISMSLDKLQTHTTVEFSEKFKKDEVHIGDSENPVRNVEGSKRERVIAQLERLRVLAHNSMHAKVVSKNSFPTGVGIASSASAFAALTLAASNALNLHFSPKELSIQTRLAGSGSATRSIFGGFVKWKKSTHSNGSFAMQLENESHWQLQDMVVLVSAQEKKHSSLEGHGAASTSSYLGSRIKELKARNAIVVQAIRDKDIEALGVEIEKDMYSLHCMAMTSAPPILYWQPATVAILHTVTQLRSQGIKAYSTMDAGPNVHIIFEKNSNTETALRNAMQPIPGIQKIIVDGVGKGARVVDNHLF